MDEPWGGLVEAVREQTEEAEPWQLAELHLLQQAFRARLDALGLVPTPEAAVLVMAAAQLVAEHTAEFGGDARDSLAEVAWLALDLLDHTTS